VQETHAGPRESRSVKNCLLALLCVLFSHVAIGAASWHVVSVPGVTQHEVHFANRGARLAGTLYMPESGSHVPAVVVFWGAALPTRQFALYKHLTEALPAMGVAVLVFDRRGSGASSGTIHGTDYKLLASDGVAAARFLAGNPRIDARKIGYWGLSQGGWLAVLAASQDQNAAFAVSVSAPLVTPAEQMDFAVGNLLAVHGYSQADIDQAIGVRHAWQGFLRGSVAFDAALQAIQGTDGKPWYGLEFMPDAADFAKQPENKEWKRDMDYDPLRIADDVHVPVLFIYGGADPWVPVARSIEHLQTLAKWRPNLEYRVIAGANHSMMLPKKVTMAFDHETLLNEAPAAPAYFMVLASWIEQQVRARDHAERTQP